MIFVAFSIIDRMENIGQFEAQIYSASTAVAGLLIIKIIKPEFNLLKNRELFADKILQHKWWRIIGITYLILIIILSFGFLLTGNDLGKYIDSSSKLMLIFIGPLAVPIIVMLVEVYIRFGKLKA